MPEFPGGQDSMDRYLMTHIQYPAAAADSAVQGRVVVGYVVNKDGTVSNVAVKRGIHPLLDAEAVRVVRTFPRHKVGMQGGVAVRVGQVVPVTFRITRVPEFVLPAFPGGEQAMKDYIKASIRRTNQMNRYLGVVPVEFTVDSEGVVSQVLCVRHVWPDVDSEAVRVIRSLPRFQPGQERGKNVSSRLVLNVSFLDEKSVVDNGGFYNGTALNEQPDFLNGTGGKIEFVKEHLLQFYSKRDKSKGLVVQLTSHPDSTISDLKVIDGINPQTDRALLDTIRQIKKMRPGMYNGRPVKSKVIFSIDTFSQIIADPAMDVMPSFPGGDEALMRFLQEHMQYPELERENDIQGTVTVAFDVEDDGRISHATIKKGVHSGIDAEALRLVGLLPAFTPGMQNGKPVKVSYNMSIAFKLAYHVLGE